MPKDLEKEIVFGIVPGDTLKLFIGISDACFADMRETGLTKTIDLNKVGIPVEVIVYGDKDHAACIKPIEDHNKAAGIATLDMRRTDFGIKD